MTRIRDILNAVATGDQSPESAETALADEGEAAVDQAGALIRSLVAGIEEFHDVTSTDQSPEDLLRLARRRFSIQVSAALEHSESEGGTTGSVQKLRSEVVELSQHLTQLIQVTIAGSQLRKELEIAGTVQKMLVPTGPVDVVGLRSAAWFRPADECSGDWWTMTRLGKSSALAVVGDVTGHGAPAAIVAAMVKGAMDMARVGMRDGLKPFMALNMVNRILLENLAGEYFMTTLVARFDPEDQSLRLGNAGHRSAWILHTGRETRTLSGDRSPPLGSSRKVKYEERQVSFGPGDMFVGFTDGIPEAENPNGEELGERTLRELCEQVAPDGPAAVCEAVKQAVFTHVGDPSRLGDDATLLAVQFPKDSA